MEFQMKTDDQEKARWPIVKLVRGIVKRDWSLDRSWREGLYGEINSRGYAGWPDEEPYR